jgi:type I restriction enzyme R subunit
MEKYEVVRAMFRPDTKGGFDYRPALAPGATPQSRLAIMAGALDWVLALQHDAAAKEVGEDGKKRAHRRYADAVTALSRAFALAGASDEARAIRDEVGFFQAIQAALAKSAPGDGKRSAADRELAIQQIVSRAVVSTEIVDIMRAAGLQSPDISILSDDFLAEVRDTPKKNLAIEALKKLINGDVRSHAKSNVTQSKAFTERLEAAIARYHVNAFTTAQVLEELIRLAKDIRAARARGEETGLSPEEIAFYDALAQNESARDVMGEPVLRVIAHELVQVIKSNVSIDWMHRTSARANIRRHVKRLLRKYGYPPDLQDAAVQNVLQQAEALSAEWAVA